MSYTVAVPNSNPICPLCGKPAEIQTWRDKDSGGFYFEGKCDRCDRISVTQSAVEKLKRESRAYLLSAYFRRRNKESSDVPIVTAENVEEIIGKMPVLRTVAEKLSALLKVYAQSIPNPGAPIATDLNKDYPLVFAANEDEMRFLSSQLLARNLIEVNKFSGQRFVTADGYERLEQLEASAFKTTRNAFVAMSFEKSRDSVYEQAIRPAIHDAGYRPIRLDRTEFLNRIDDEIIAQIRESRFMVADFTGQRGGVYFESGFMHGLGRNVYWMCEKSDLSNVHFDTRQYNFIDYDTTEQAQTRLHNRIMAIEGKGPGDPSV
jgi:nucleoside 2-deoxyribosyltransferase